MPAHWIPIDEAAEYFAISRDKLYEAMRDAARAGIDAPMVDHGTPQRACPRFCVAALDAWMLEVGRWRRAQREAARAARIAAYEVSKPRATSPPVQPALRNSRRKPPMNPMRQKLAALETPRH